MRWICVGLAIAALVGPVYADEPEPEPGSAIDPEAMAILQRAVAPIAAAKSLRGVYTQFPVPATLDETLDFLELEVGAAIPLADLFYSDLSSLGSAADEASVVGTSRVAEWRCDHLAFRGDALDYQIWVEQGDAPRLRKLVITYREEPGTPQFAAVFTSWELGIDAPDALFEFSPPEGAERIPTLARPRDLAAQVAR
jgi:hypothetical protein